MTYRVIWLERAVADLKAVYYPTAERADSKVALRFVQRIEAAGERLANFPNRGRPRTEIEPGLRSIPYGRSITIFYAIDGDEVRIVHVLHARRDAVAAFRDD